MITAALLLLLATTTPVEGPVAVLPFKNLNGDAALDWLRLGIVETLIADLKRDGRVAVVERTQVDRALTEIALQSGRATEESTASRAGKLVGARTVVIGSFQRAGRTMRINARFVTVETGVVVEAAKVTGPIAGVFDLQDQVVDKLVGRPAAERPRRKRGPKSVRAFELYAMSMAVSSDADRVGYLKSSLAADPDFVYSQEQLGLLEERMRGYSKTSSELLAVEEANALSRIEDPTTPTDSRLRDATSLVEGLRTARRFNTLAAVAPSLSAAKGVDLSEISIFARFCAEMGRHRFDNALSAGELFLKNFPTSPRFAEVERTLKEIVADRRKRDSRRAEYEADVADLRKDLGDGGALVGERLLRWDYAPCLATRWNSLVGDVMFQRCSEFVGRHEKDPDNDAKEKVSAARFFMVLALSEKGELVQAQSLAERVRAESHAWDDDLTRLMATWPTDVAAAAR